MLAYARGLCQTGLCEELRWLILRRGEWENTGRAEAIRFDINHQKDRARTPRRLRAPGRRRSSKAEMRKTESLRRLLRACRRAPSESLASSDPSAQQEFQ